MEKIWINHAQVTLFNLASIIRLSGAVWRAGICVSARLIFQRIADNCNKKVNTIFLHPFFSTSQLSINLWSNSAIYFYSTKSMRKNLTCFFRKKNKTNGWCVPSIFHLPYLIISLQWPIIFLENVLYRLVLFFVFLLYPPEAMLLSNNMNSCGTRYFYVYIPKHLKGLQLDFQKKTMTAPGKI